MSEPIPKTAAPYIRFADDGRPYLQGSRCTACGQVYLGDREDCGRCSAQGMLTPKPLANRGVLYNYTIVYRSFPGVATPFISAIVDLDGGGTVKGNLIEIAPDPQAIRFDMPVEVVFRDAGLANPDAAGATAHFFIAAETGETR